MTTLDDIETRYAILADTINRCQDTACRAIMTKQLQGIANERAELLIKSHVRNDYEHIGE